MTLREQVARVIDREAFTAGPWMWWERQQAALTKAAHIIALLIPPGHVVVPVEPDDRQIEAGLRDLTAYLNEDIERSEDALASIYRAMLSARPAGEDKP